MARSKQNQFISSGSTEALVAFLIHEYKLIGERALGRTILQKLCYFARASGVPLPFRFEIYHYGPFSQEIFQTTERLLPDRVITDASGTAGQSDYAPGPQLDLLLEEFSAEIKPHSDNLKRVATMFSKLSPAQMELVSTIHYLHRSRREWFNKAPRKHAVVESVLEVKGGKFDKATIEGVYEVLVKAHLLA